MKMGKMMVRGGGVQVVKYHTASGHESSRLNAWQSEELEVNDSGDQLFVDFCFFECGKPTTGPADVLPGDEAIVYTNGRRGICLKVGRGVKLIYSKAADGEYCA